MKIRADFVTNSSSSSFIIDRNKLTIEQFNKILNHIGCLESVITDMAIEIVGEAPDEIGSWSAWYDRFVKEKQRIKNDEGLYYDNHDRWTIKFLDWDRIELSTDMDNFDMGDFLERIDADMAVIHSKRNA